MVRSPTKFLQGIFVLEAGTGYPVEAVVERAVPGRIAGVAAHGPVPERIVDGSTGTVVS